MSAIWGIVDFGGKEIKKNEIEEITSSFSKWKIDKIQDICKDNYYLATGIQNIVKEAQFEQFPYTYMEGKVMVADVIVDNRDEIVTEFKLTNELSRKGIDGSVLYEAVAKDLRKALDKLCGAFVFAEYDVNKKKIYVANDVVGNRSVYYLFSNGRFIFSTLLNPIVSFLGSIEVEKKWLKQFIKNENLLIVKSPSLTPYKGIYRLEPGELLTVSEHGISHTGYWNPHKTRKTLKLKTDDDYKAVVLDTFRKCVESVIRDPGNTGILLSGGLDSNAVAAFAAPYLKEKNKNLYSYTSVPNEEITPIPTNMYYVENERIYVEKLKDYHDNLIPRFINTSEQNILSENEEYLRIIETPVKTMANTPWLYKAFKLAKKDGCNILLGGQYGNITISYGIIDNYFATLKFSGRIISLGKAMYNYSRMFKISKKKLLNGVLREKRIHTLKQSRRFMYDKKALRQIGESELHKGLALGIMFRDPTRDRRLIELTMSLPLEQFIHLDIDRRLVRVYMQDLIPKEICMDIFHRGAQGKGGHKYIRTHWEEIKCELKNKYNLRAGKEYLSKLKLCEWIENVNINNETKDFEYIKAIYYGLLCEFLEDMNKRKIVSDNLEEHEQEKI